MAKKKKKMSKAIAFSVPAKTRVALWIGIKAFLVYVTWFAAFKETETLWECDWAKNLLWMSTITAFLSGIALNVATELACEEKSDWALELLKPWVSLPLALAFDFGFAFALVYAGWIINAMLWSMGMIMYHVCSVRSLCALAKESES